jgi:hypothetical protein
MDRNPSKMPKEGIMFSLIKKKKSEAIPNISFQPWEIPSDSSSGW